MDWKGIVSSIAPTIGTALCGPIGGTAVKFLADKFLGNENATEDELREAILGAKPEDLVKIKSLESEFKLQMRKLDIDIERLHQLDRASARDLAKTDIKPHVVFSVLFIGGYFVILILIMNGGVKIDDKIFAVFTTVFGVVTASIQQIMNFWFGSSKGSKDKTTALENAVANAKNNR